MARKQSVSKEKTEIKKAVESGNAIIGTDLTLKGIRGNSVAKVFLSSNCSQETAEEIRHLCGLSDIKVVELPYPNEELGAICKKPFSISVIGLKGAK